MYSSYVLGRWRRVKAGLRIAGVAMLALASVAVCLACFLTYQESRPQGDAPPIAPTIAKWDALAPDAPFTYHVTEIIAGDRKNGEMLPTVKPLALNNAAQVVGEVWQGPPTAPAWVRQMLHLPYVSYFNHLKYSHATQTAFFWDAGRTDILPYPAETTSVTASFINENGQIAGELSQDSSTQNTLRSYPVFHAALWENFRAAPRDVGASFGIFSSRVLGLNAKGQVGVLVDGIIPNSSDAADKTLYGQSVYLWDNDVSRLAARGPQFYGLLSQVRGLQNNGEMLGFDTNTKGDEAIPAIISPFHTPVSLPAAGRGGTLLRRNERGGMLISKRYDGLVLIQDGVINPFWPVNYQLDGLNTSLNQNGDVAGIGAYKGEMRAWAFLWRKNRLNKVADLLGPSPLWKIDDITGMNDRGQLLCTGHHLPEPSGPFAYNDRVLLLTPVLYAAPQKPHKGKP